MKSYKTRISFVSIVLLAVAMLCAPLDAFSQSKSAKLKNDKKKT